MSEDRSYKEGIAVCNLLEKTERNGLSARTFDDALPRIEPIWVSVSLKPDAGQFPRKMRLFIDPLGVLIEINDFMVHYASDGERQNVIGLLQQFRKQSWQDATHHINDTDFKLTLFHNPSATSAV